MSQPKIIKDFPGRAVEQFRAEHQGRLPQEVEMKQAPRTLIERLYTAAQVCRHAGMLSCEASVKEAIAKLGQVTEEKSPTEQQIRDIFRKEFVRIDENQNLVHRMTEDIAVATVKAVIAAYPYPFSPRGPTIPVKWAATLAFDHETREVSGTWNASAQFDCHYDGVWNLCDKQGCHDERQCKRRTSGIPMNKTL
jgi:hypothetical protein